MSDSHSVFTWLILTHVAFESDAVPTVATSSTFATTQFARLCLAAADLAIEVLNLKSIDESQLAESVWTTTAF